MARGNAVWGIDIGQSGLKALRCVLESDGKTVRAEAFDFIEYPKILSQPDAEPDALIRDALKEFLSRNSVRGDKVAISVSGQSGLARFIKLPPVEKKKIPDIVKYEAKQQIPFDLDDVIWSYQAMPGSEKAAENFLETEVGLFAMKREHVFRALRPLDDAGIELDIVQLTPIAIYNAVTYGVLTDLPSPDEYDPENPPPWVVILSLGTEATDLVVTNGFRIWNRSIPLGGNHFTKQLTKEMKLTFGKAEQLKRNSRDAENAKEVFQAMRSVFNDLVTEVNRSMGYFKTIERKAEISRIVAMGNTIKLPGLQQYLTKNLGLPVDRVNSYEHLQGADVTAAPAFEDNVSTYAVCYGLVLQGLGLAKMSTNLVPRELVVARIIRRKKPWALAAVAVTLVALSFNYMFHLGRWKGSRQDPYQSAYSALTQAQSTSSKFNEEDGRQQTRLAMLKQLGHEVVGNAEGRVLMLELLKVVNDSLPRPEGADPMAISQIPIESGSRPEIHIDHIEMQYKSDLSEWFTDDAKERYLQGQGSNLDGEITSTAPTGAVAEGGEPVAGEGAAGDEVVSDPAVGDLAGGPADGSSPDDATAAGSDPAAAGANAPTAANAAAEPPEAMPGGGIADVGGAVGGADGETAGPQVDGSVLAGRAGWIVELKCKHYYNNPHDPIARKSMGAQYVRNTLLHNLRKDRTLVLPVPGNPASPTKEYRLEQVGIFFPLIAADKDVTGEKIPNPNWSPPIEVFEETAEGGMGRNTFGGPRRAKPAAPPVDEKENPREFNALVYEFTIQFAWIPRRFSERDEPLEAGSSSSDTMMTTGG